MQFKIEEFQKQVQLAVTEQVQADDAAANRWVELALVAPHYFGPDCFMPGSKAREEMRVAILDSFKCPEAPARDDKSDTANSIRAKRKHASTFTSVAVARMVKYYETAIGAKTEVKATVPLDAFAARMIKQLIGHGEKVKPSVHGDSKAIASLVNHLKKLAGDAYKAPATKAGTKAKRASKKAGKIEVPAANDSLADLAARMVAINKAA